MILEKDIKNCLELASKEDEWICRLQTLNPTALNTEHGQYASEIFNSWALDYNQNNQR